MKTKTATATPAAPQRSSRPFFRKGADGMFSQETTPFFSPTSGILQTKLTVGQPGDKFEREADAMADKVVHRLAMPETTPATAGNLDVQTKCSSCEKEEKQLQQKEKPEEEQVQRKPIFESEASPDVQAKCATCEAEEKQLQKKELPEEKEQAQRKPIFESEANPDVQTKCAACEEEEKVQRKENNTDAAIMEPLAAPIAPEAPAISPVLQPAPVQTKPRLGKEQETQQEETEQELPGLHKKPLADVQCDAEAAASPAASLETTLNSSKGGGQGLPTTLRSHMETAFGADFGAVRLHTDSKAQHMSQDLHAQAFTHGSDIYFNRNKLDTASGTGQHLLAHELTHVVQQGKSTPLVQKQEAGVLSDEDIEKDGDTVYHALHGWTTSGDSAKILDTFRGKNRIDTNKIVDKVVDKASMSTPEVYAWMLDDMTTADWKALLKLFINVRAYLIETAIARQVYKLVTGLYVSADDSRQAYEYFNGDTPLTGDLLDNVLVRLEAETDEGTTLTAVKLFHRMESTDAYHLSDYFFNSFSILAVRFASAWVAYKVVDLLSGFTSGGDSTSIVQNIQRVPDAWRSYVLLELEKQCQDKWQQSASFMLMDNMDGDDYITLQQMAPDQLEPYSPRKGFLGWDWKKIARRVMIVEYIIEYALCGLVGVVLGVLNIIKDIVVMVWDIIRAVYDIVGMVICWISGGELGCESRDRVYGFFKSLAQFFGAPGEAVSQMWSELMLEASLIEGPFKECNQAIFWVTKITNVIVNIVLVFVAGYGVAKAVVESIEALATLVRAGELLKALRALPGRLYEAIKGLPSAAAKSIASGAGKIVELIKAPAKIIAEVRDTLTAVRLAAEEEGYFNVLRKQAGKVVENESEYWKKRKSFWKSRAQTIDAGVTGTEGKLAAAVDTATTDTATGEKIVAQTEGETNAAQHNADDLMNDVKGKDSATAKEGQGPEADKKEQQLQQTAAKEGPITQEEVQAEAGWARENMGRKRPSSMQGYVEEIELPNGHTWRKTNEGVWCRFSPFPPSLCTREFESAPDLKPGRKLSKTEVSHDIGAQLGREYAQDVLGLEDAPEAVNPFEFHGKFGQGFDDIMRRPGTDDLVIVEYKGGSAELTGDQMQASWVQSRIARMRSQGGDLGKFMADILEKKLNEGKLYGVALQTPVSEAGVPGATTVIKTWKY
ncbi:DUF4157 domain-containing protein [Chitinophaga sp. 212800010-3]|uniref:eCIS core domain-containing protein n=1 Tax=unclassified Chitinophaga TaxID=2619133 RepID=UPI002DE3AED1|nr:hypothetical protein [Chitinophaga sp. 212800010-3]